MIASRPRALLALAALALSSTIACAPTDPKDPKTWIARLSEGDAHKRQQAIQELRRMKAKEAAPALAPLLKDPQSREDAALALGDVGGPDQVQPLIDAIDTTVGAGSDQATRTANRTNGKIADALGLLGDARACSPLLRLARAQDDLVKLSAVQSLGAIKCKEAVPELARLIDDASAPPLLIKKAVIALGQIGDPAAIPALEHALVMEKGGASFLPESSFALFLIGKPAVAPLISLLNDGDAQWLIWAKENRRAQAGTYAKAAIVLGDIGDSAAAPALTAKLNYTDNDPMPDTARLLTGVVRQFAANALGQMVVTAAAPKIAALPQTKEPADYDLADFSANALVWIGDRAQAPVILKKAAAPGAIKPRLALVQGAALLGDASLIKDLDAIAAKEKSGKPAACVEAATQLAGQPLADESHACDKVADAFTALKAPLVAAQACASGDAAAQQSCWAGKLTDKTPLVRARAAYELGHAGQPSSVAPLVKALTDDDLTARLAAIRAAGWLTELPACKAELKSAAPQVAAQLQAEAGRVQFLKVDEELKRLQVKLARL